MDAEDILGALVTHSQDLDLGKPDPLIMASNPGKIGKRTPTNWRLLIGKAGGKKIELSPTRTALGGSTYKPSRFSIAEVAADALVGIPERNWKTLQCSIGVPGDARSIVMARLWTQVQHSKRSDKFWPDKIRRRGCRCGRAPAENYALDIVEMAIRSLENPAKFSTHQARADWFGMSESHWRAVGSKPFDHVSAHLWSWYHAGIGHIQNRINRRRGS